MKRTGILVLTIAFFITILFFSNAYAKKSIGIGYFNNFPQAELIGVHNKWYEEEMGIDIKWRNFNDGGEMMAAMASGGIQIGYAVGMPPFIIAVSKGLPLTLISVNMDNDEIDNFVARNGSGIVSPADLVGKKVGLPYASGCYYKAKGVLKAFRIKDTELMLLDMVGPDIVAAFKRGDIDAGFIWQPFMGELLKNGHKILEAKDISNWGYSIPDVGCVNTKYLKENRDIIVKFLVAVERSKRFYFQNPEEAYKIIGKVSGTTPESAKDIMKDLYPYTTEVQLTPRLMGTPEKPGRIAQNLKGVAEFLVEQGKMEKVLDDYSQIIDQTIAIDALKAF